MELKIITYIIYIAISTLAAVSLGQTLFSNGKVFLQKIFCSQISLIEPINKVLLAGFYLTNIGFIFYYLGTENSLITGLEAIEFVCTKTGFVLLLLGGMHTFNMLTFYIINHYLNTKSYGNY
jgi:hypothetical protein